MRIMAIDWGRKRCGIAVTDPLQIIAQGLTTVETHMALVFLRDYVSREPVEVILVGDPRSLDGSPTDATVGADEFTKKLKRHFPGVRVERVEEQYSSQEATKALREMGLRKKDRQRKELVDEVAAVILLQEYMGRKG